MPREKAARRELVRHASSILLVSEENDANTILEGIPAFLRQKSSQSVTGLSRSKLQAPFCEPAAG
jgi:hypothetical protein